MESLQNFTKVSTFTAAYAAQEVGYYYTFVQGGVVGILLERPAILVKVISCAS